MPILGETPEVKASGRSPRLDQGGPGIARAVAEWATRALRDRRHGADVARFYPHQRTQRTSTRARRGLQQDLRDRPPDGAVGVEPDVRAEPVLRARAELGAVFFETAGWERPWWYESNAPLLEEYGDRVMPREAEWESRWWSPIINAEHLAMRDRVAMIDLSAFAIFDVAARRARRPPAMALAEMDVELGRVVYTPILDHDGGFKADLTIMRLGDEHFRIVTGGAHGMARPEVVLATTCPRTARPQLDDVTRAGARSASGARAPRDVVASSRATTSRTRAFRSRAAARSSSGRCRRSPRASRTSASSAGSSTRRWSRARAVGRLWEAGQPHRDRAGRDRRLRHDRADREGLPRVRRRARVGVQRRRGRHAAAEGEGADFVGKEALPPPPRGGAGAILCTLTVDDPTSSTGVKRYMLGASRS
jgi:hypothetical protein